MKLAILSPTNVDFLAAELRKFDIESYTPPYGHVVMEAVNPDSDLYKFAPEVIMLFFDAFEVLGDRVLRPFEADQEPSSLLDDIRSSVAAIATHSAGTRIVLNTVPVPALNGMSRLEQNTSGGLRPVQYAHNESVAQLAAEFPQVLVHDYAALAESSGLSDWYDSRMWFLARTRLSRHATVRTAQDINNLLLESSRARAKVIVVDLDNTCWGGVIGDDGLGGIVLGPDGPGLAFSTFQKALLNFRDQGVLLAVASKNEMSVVQEVFENHAGMILSKQDITSWQVHWQDKAISISRIAKDLDLGVDSFVFFDDNPVERLRISEAHAGVTVVDVPTDPAEYVDALLSCTALKTTSLTDEDLVRPDQYQARDKRKQTSANFTDPAQFLASLGTKIVIDDISVDVLPRIAQLTQKTNQFNLRSQRYTEADLTRMMQEQTHRAFWLRLTDRFGDEGIVAVAIIETSSEWFLDTLLMSCRVIGRGVEQAFVKHLKSEALSSGIQVLKAEYIPSGRNEMVSELLPSMNFTEESDIWRTETNSEGPDGPGKIEVVRFSTD
jgi:FkbH-like protein